MVFDILGHRIDFRNPASIYRLVGNEMKGRCRKRPEHAGEGLHGVRFCLAVNPSGRIDRP
jgi:hypothetical protein